MPSQTPKGQNLREIRLLVRYRGTLRRVCKLVFSKQDASMYLLPYGTIGRYFYGGQTIMEEEINHTFNFKEQFQGDKIPKLSIHESGQVHVSIEREKKAGPLQTVPLPELRGEHIASVSIDALEKLPMHEEEPKTIGTEQDVVINVDDEAQSGRFKILVNAASVPIFEDRCALIVHMQRPYLETPIHICFVPIRQDPLGPEGKGGVTVIAGWNPRKGAMETLDLLYIRAQ